VVIVGAVITDPSEVKKTLECLKRNNAPLFKKNTQGLQILMCIYIKERVTTEGEICAYIFWAIP
jgi:hypothetical protein